MIQKKKDTTDYSGVLATGQWAFDIAECCVNSIPTLTLFEGKNYVAEIK